MNNTKSILLFGEIVVLCREFIITTKLYTISGDVGDILLNVIKDSHAGYMCSHSGYIFKESLNSNSFKTIMINKIIIFLNGCFVGVRNAHLESILNVGSGTVPIFYIAPSILSKFGEIIMPIIDYLEIDDRLLIHNKDWMFSLSKLYNRLIALKLIDFVNFNKSNNHITGYNVALLERYTLPNNHKVNSFYTSLPHIIKHDMKDLFISMRLNK